MLQSLIGLSKKIEGRILNMEVGVWNKVAGGERLGCGMASMVSLMHQI